MSATLLNWKGLKMGCDIHLHQEVKINGRWEHYRELSLDRDYQLFSKMAGVRGTETPICQPRGMPEDATVMTKFCCERDGVDGHTHTWLNAKEIAELEAWVKNRMMPENRWRLEMDYWGYLFGNSWGSFASHPQEQPRGLEDVRFVFWFDN